MATTSSNTPRCVADQTEMALAAVHVLDGTARERAAQIKKKIGS
jgi:hypothetical protein